jgi:hypothetical protein
MMGYHAYTHLVYGVPVTEKQAQKLYEEFNNEDEGEFNVAPDCDYEIDLRSDGTDGRAESLYYEPGCDHYFGIILTDDSKKVSKMMKKPPKDLNEVFEKHVAPVLKKHKIKTKPDFHIFVQTI